MTDIVKTEPVQLLLDRASGTFETAGDPRLKAILRDVLEAVMRIIERHDIAEGEFWGAVRFLQDGSGEFGLIVPGVGLEHFLDLHMDAKDAEQGRFGGTPRTIEGPLYVEGAPLAEGDVNLSLDPDETGTLSMTGLVRGPEGEAVQDAIVHVWHANSKGFYSHFDPTSTQSAFNNRRRIKLGADGRYTFHSRMPHGYSCPPGGATEALMKSLGRHGDRPAHVHFLIEAPGYRTLTTQINFGDDPLAENDFAFGTREGLLPIPNRQGDRAHIAFDFELQKAKGPEEEKTVEPGACARMNKLYPDARAALDGLLFDGMTIMSGGFGLVGNPENLIPAICEGGVSNLTVISNNCGAEGFGLYALLANGQIRKMISSYVGENRLFERLYLEGKLELELNPQGTLAERIRAGGAGIPAFYTATGVGTVVAEGKPIASFDGKLYVQERWLRADLAIVRAWKGDTHGNLVFRKTARNFNPPMATAAKVTIAEVEQLVEAGELDPDHIHTPGIFVDRIVVGTTYERRIEKLTVRTDP